MHYLSPTLIAVLGLLNVFTPLSTAIPLTSDVQTLERDLGIDLGRASSPNPAHLRLLKRADVAPDDCKCDQRSHWRGRSCDGKSPQSWEDYCLRPPANGHAGELYNRPGSCPPETECKNTIDNSGKNNVHCTAKLKGGSAKKKAKEYLSGLTRIFAGFGAPKERRDRESEVRLIDAIPGATVSFFLRATSGDYIVPAAYGMSATLKSTGKLLCSYDTSTHYCSSHNTVDLKASDSVVFKVGLVANQEVDIDYAFLGRHPDV